MLVAYCVDESTGVVCTVLYCYWPDPGAMAHAHAWPEPGPPRVISFGVSSVLCGSPARQTVALARVAPRSEKRKLPQVVPGERGAGVRGERDRDVIGP